MAQSNKISRKTIKQPDEFQVKGERVLQHVIDNKNRYFLIAGGIIAIIIVGALIGKVLEWRQDKISKAFSEALEAYEAPVVDKIDPNSTDLQFDSEETKLLAASEKLDEFLAQYGSSAYGTTARFFKANALFNLKRYDKAREEYERFIDDGGSSFEQFDFLARFNIGQTFIGEEKYDDALAVYQDMLKDDDPAWKDQAAFAIGKIYHIQGKTDEAVKTLEGLKNDYPDSDLISKVDKLLLVLRGPEKPKPEDEKAAEENKKETERAGEGG